MSEDMKNGYLIGRMVRNRRVPYVLQIDDFSGDRDEFIKGLRLAGYHGEVKFYD